MGVTRDLEIGSSPRSTEENHRGQDDRGISFCETISSSKSSYKSSNGSVAEEDDVSSQFADNSSHDIEDDRTSNSDADSDDIAEKIKWFFLNIEQPEDKETSAQQQKDRKLPESMINKQ